ncbi:MAG TPA: MFS transporter, partial [Acidimicrobiales bacterium]|nr:MFS transporter [Acidimicrobiales bacterium]
MRAPATTRSERLFTFRFALVVTSGLCYFMALGVLLPVVPLFVKHDLGGNDIAVGVVVGAFAVGAVLLRPFTGRIGDRVGRRILIVVGGVIVGGAGLLYLFASAIVPLVFVRVLGGVGEAAFFVGAASMITDLAPEERRGEAISYWSIAVYGGLAFGPLIGNLLLGDDHFDRVWIVSASLAFAAGFIGLFTRDVASFNREQAA